MGQYRKIRRPDVNFKYYRFFLSAFQGRPVFRGKWGQQQILNEQGTRMSYYVNAATMHFTFQAPRKSPGERAATLNYLRNALGNMEGYDLDLLVTCEGFESTCQCADQAEQLENYGEMLGIYSDFAKKEHCTVAASVKLAESGRVFNSLAFIGPEGESLGCYHKNFLTPREYDPIGLSAGKGAVVVDTPAGKIGGLICFDLNFTELLEEYMALKPDILAFSSMYHGGYLQAHWAFQSRAFFVSACKDTASEIRDPLGRVLASSNCYSDCAMQRLNLDRFFMHGDENSNHFPDIMRKYGRAVEIVYPGSLGCAVLYSHMETLSAADIAQEFGLQTADDYFSYSRQLRKDHRANIEGGKGFGRS